MLTRTIAAALFSVVALAACGAAGDGGVEAGACTPSASRCSGAGVVETCTTDGLTWTPEACPAGQTCATVTSVYAVCRAEADAVDDTSDDSGPDLPVAVCSPGATECDGDATLRTCADDGGAWSDTPCEYRCVVDDNGVALCRDQVCEAGTHRCGGAKNLLICKEDGTGFDTFPCPAGAECNPGLQPAPECEAGPTCSLGAKACDDSGRFLKTCVGSGDDTTFDWQKCPYGCDPDAKACKDAVCDAGAHRCRTSDPDTIEECNPTQTGWQFVQTCTSGCAGGLCEDKACLEGQMRCNYYAVETCSAAATWEFVEGCQGTVCVEDGSDAFCAGCVPGVDFCDGGDVMTCPDASGVAVVKEACAPGSTCVDAACLDQVVLSDDLGTDASFLALAEAVTFCWMDHEGDADSALCAAVDAGGFSSDVTADAFIDAWYCTDDVYYDVLLYDFAGGDEAALWQAEGLFSCDEPANRTVDMKAAIPAGSTDTFCVWYDTWATPEVIIDTCTSFDSLL